jgi:hypothetical protein
VGVPPSHTAKRCAATGPYAHRESNEPSWPPDYCSGLGFYSPLGLPGSSVTCAPPVQGRCAWWSSLVVGTGFLAAVQTTTPEAARGCSVRAGQGSLLRPWDGSGPRMVYGFGAGRSSDLPPLDGHKATVSRLPLPVRSGARSLWAKTGPSRSTSCTMKEQKGAFRRDRGATHSKRSLGGT